MVGLVGQNQPDLSKVSVLKQGSEAGNGLTLVGPRTCPKETIQDNSRGYGNSASRARKEEKPRGKPSSPELLTVGLTGFEPATSTPPELHWKTAKPSIPYFTVSNVTGKSLQTT